MSRASANQRAQPTARGQFLSIYSTSSPTDYHLMQSTARILENIGFSAATPECLTTLASMMKLHLDNLSLCAKTATEHAGRSDVNVKDVAVAFKKNGVNVNELFDYVRQVASFPPPVQLPLLPVAELSAEMPSEETAVKLEELSAPGDAGSQVGENNGEQEQQRSMDGKPKRLGRRPFPDFSASKADDLGILVAPPRIEPERALSPMLPVDEPLSSTSRLSPPLLTAAATKDEDLHDAGVIETPQEEAAERPVVVEKNSSGTPPVSPELKADTVDEAPPEKAQQDPSWAESREKLVMTLPKAKHTKHKVKREKREKEGVDEGRAGDTDAPNSTAPRVEDMVKSLPVQSSIAPIGPNEAADAQVPLKEEFTAPVVAEASLTPAPVTETVPKLVFRRPPIVNEEEERRAHKKEKKANKRKRSERRADKPQGPRTPPLAPTASAALPEESVEAGELPSQSSTSAEAAPPDEPQKPKITLTIKIGQQSATSRDDFPAAEAGGSTDLSPPPKKVKREDSGPDESVTATELPSSTPTPSHEIEVSLGRAKAPTSRRPSGSLPPIESAVPAPVAKRKPSKTSLGSSTKPAPSRKIPPPKIKLPPVRKGTGKQTPCGDPTPKRPVASTTSIPTLLGAKKTAAKRQKNFTAATGKKSTNKGKGAKEEKEEDGDSICPVCSIAYTDNDDGDWICCDKCDNWYHWHCVGILFEPPKDKKWYCPKCKKDK